MNEERFSVDSARQYVRSLGRKRMTFYCNVRGWDWYLTLQPTIATPTGKLKDFPRVKQIRLQ